MGPHDLCNDVIQKLIKENEKLKQKNENLVQIVKLFMTEDMSSDMYFDLCINAKIELMESEGE
jgi:hypothetical protein